MHQSVFDIWAAMGDLARGVVLLLAAMSFVSLAIGIEKWWVLRRAAAATALFLARWRQCREGLQAAPARDGPVPSPVERLVAAASQVLGRDVDRGVRLEAYPHVVRQEIITTSMELRRGLGFVATVGSTAPFVGLFGTVVGIVNAFERISATGQGGLATVSAGIAEALVATALGIFVAIPAVWLFNLITQRITRTLAEMEAVAEEILVTALTASDVASTSLARAHAAKGDAHGDAT